MSGWKHYLPAILCFFFAWLFFRVPALAVVLTSGALLFFGTLYAMIVFKFHRAQKHMASTQNTFDAEYSSNEPNFRNVTVHVVRGTPWFKQP